MGTMANVLRETAQAQRGPSSEVLGLGIVPRIEGNAESEAGRQAAPVRFHRRAVAQDHVVLAYLEITGLREAVPQGEFEPEMAREGRVGEAEQVNAESFAV